MKFCIDRENRTVEITQPAYYDNVFEGWEVTGSVLSPHTEDLFKVQIDELHKFGGQSPGRELY